MMTKEPARSRLHNDYVQMLDRADLVLSNFHNLKEGFDFIGRDIHVIPNAAERINWSGKISKPDSLAGLDGKIIGYVGNLRDRVDVDLLHAMRNVIRNGILS